MRSPRTGGGFTLLEVMVAMTILAGALLGITLALSRSVAASQHARFMTQASFLCRQQLVQMEDKFIVDGFTDDSFTKEDKGAFEDPAFKRFRWQRIGDMIGTRLFGETLDHSGDAGRPGRHRRRRRR